MSNVTKHIRATNSQNNGAPVNLKTGYFAPVWSEDALGLGATVFTIGLTPNTSDQVEVTYDPVLHGGNKIVIDLGNEADPATGNVLISRDRLRELDFFVYEGQLVGVEIPTAAQIAAAVGVGGQVNITTENIIIESN